MGYTHLYVYTNICGGGTPSVDLCAPLCDPFCTYTHAMYVYAYIYKSPNTNMCTTNARETPMNAQHRVSVLYCKRTRIYPTEHPKHQYHIYVMYVYIEVELALWLTVHMYDDDDDGAIVVVVVALRLRVNFV